MTDTSGALDAYIVIPFKPSGQPLNDTFWSGQAKSYQQATTIAVWCHGWPSGTKTAARLSRMQFHGRTVDHQTIVHSEVP